MYTPAVRLLLTLLILCLCSAAVAEQRQVFAADSPRWLRAVGKLTVPGHRFVEGEKLHQREDCSATLIAPQVILSAWHCLEHYRDLSRDITFRLPHAPEQPVLRATRLADGGDMDGDWALLRLERPLDDVAPLVVTAYRPDQAAHEFLIAGYSGDEGLGAGGDKLTWQSNCKLLGHEQYRLATDCVAFKGASGGPVLAGGNIIGVISAGDGETMTYFVPSTAFISAVRLHAARSIAAR